MMVLAPLPIGFAVFMVHLATIPITGTGINPARSLGAAVVYNNSKAWSDQVRTHFCTYYKLHSCKVARVQIFKASDHYLILLHYCSYLMQWIFWVGPFIGAAIAALYHQIVLRAGARGYGSFRSNA